MRETLTESVKQSLAAAQTAARSLNQDFVGTEHLMLGLLGTDADASRVLRALHATPADLQSSIMSALPKGADAPVVTGDLSLSPKSQRVFNGAIVKAQAMHERQVSTRCLLLSLLDDLPETVRKSLSRAGVDPHELAAKLTEKPMTAEV